MRRPALSLLLALVLAILATGAATGYGQRQARAASCTLSCPSDPTITCTSATGNCKVVGSGIVCDGRGYFCPPPIE